MNNLKSKAGFTLVELIVVIAILAILAGVGTAAYTGYIEKAKEAKDTQILSAINTALSAACTENGVAPTTITSASVTITDNKVAGITVELGDSDAENAKEDLIEGDFTTYFAGNTNTVLGYYTSFSFSAGNFSGVHTES